jgi:hypothetical protein
MAIIVRNAPFALVLPFGYGCAYPHDPFSALLTDNYTACGGRQSAFSAVSAAGNRSAAGCATTFDDSDEERTHASSAELGRLRRRHASFFADSWRGRWAHSAPRARDRQRHDLLSGSLIMWLLIRNGLRAHAAIMRALKSQAGPRHFIRASVRSRNVVCGYRVFVTARAANTKVLRLSPLGGSLTLNTLIEDANDSGLELKRIYSSTAGRAR